MASPAKKRVVVTGLGAVSALGCDVNQIWSNIMAAQNAFKVLGPEFDECASNIGAIVHEEFDMAKYAKPFPAKAPSGAFSYKAFEEAIADSGYSIDTQDKEFRAGILHSPGFSGVVPFYEDGKRIAKKGLRGSDRLIGLKVIINIISGILSGKFSLRGPISCVNFGALTGALQIMDAISYIQVGMCDVCLAGASDVSVGP
jgi:3-oxoacyl-[acyl-carrier-protein] synthase II